MAELEKLVLDTCEHVVDACAGLAETLLPKRIALPVFASDALASRATSCPPCR